MAAKYVSAITLRVFFALVAKIGIYDEPGIV
jgi:hypothetical protein